MHLLGLNESSRGHAESLQESASVLLDCLLGISHMKPEIQGIVRRYRDATHSTGESEDRSTDLATELQKLEAISA
jgi:hypothetical protein